MSAGVAVGRLSEEKEEQQYLQTGLPVDVIPRNTNTQQQPKRQTPPSDFSWKRRTPVSLTQEELQSASAAWLPGQLSDDGKELNFLTENDTKFMLRWAEGLLAETTEQQSVNNGELAKAKQGVNQQSCFPVYTQACGAAQRQETPINSQQLGDPRLPSNTNKTPNKRTFPLSQKCASLACAMAPDVQWYKCCTGSSPHDIVAQYASGRTVNVVQLDGVLFTFDDPQAVQVLSTQKASDVSVALAKSARRPTCRRQLWPDDQQKDRPHDITEGAPWYFNFPQKIRGGTTKRPIDCTADRSEAPTHMSHEGHQKVTPSGHRAKRRQLDRANRTYKGSGLQA